MCSCVPHVEHSIRRRPRNITHAQQRARVKAIIISGLNNVVDVRNALQEHLNMVVSTNTKRHALDEQVLGHQISKRSRCSWPRMCVVGWNLLNVIKIELTIHDWHW